MNANLYELLGLDPSKAPEHDPSAIREAWRAQCSKHHPDREGGNADKMAEVNRAYEVLSDAERRAAYDATGEVSGDSLEIQAQEGLMLLFRAMLDHATPLHDYFQSSQEMLQHKLREITAVKVQAAHMLNRHQKALGQIKRKNPGRDAFKLVTEELIQLTQQQIKQLDFEFDKHTRMLEILREDYEGAAAERTQSLLTGNWS